MNAEFEVNKLAVQLPAENMCTRRWTSFTVELSFYSLDEVVVNGPLEKKWQCIGGIFIVHWNFTWSTDATTDCLSVSKICNSHSLENMKVFKLLSFWQTSLSLANKNQNQKWIELCAFYSQNTEASVKCFNVALDSSVNVVLLKVVLSDRVHLGISSKC